MATIDINSIQSAKRLQADNAKVQKKLSDIESAISQSAKTITKYLDGKVTKTELVNQLDSVRTPDVEKVTELLEQIKQSISEQQPTDLTPITDGIQAVISTTKQLADKIPTNEAKDYTDGLNALLSTAQDIEQTLKDKELSVNVAAPNVAVDAPDLKPLHADNQKIIKAITDIAMPKFSTAELQDGQKELLDVLKKILAKPVGGGGGGGVLLPLIVTERFDSAGGYDYIGEAPVGTGEAESAWTITRYSSTEGKVALNVAWNDRIGAIYG